MKVRLCQKTLLFRSIGKDESAGNWQARGSSFRIVRLKSLESPAFRSELNASAFA